MLQTHEFVAALGPAEGHCAILDTVWVFGSMLIAMHGSVLQCSAMRRPELLFVSYNELPLAISELRCSRAAAHLGHGRLVDTGLGVLDERDDDRGPQPQQAVLSSTAAVLAVLLGQLHRRVQNRSPNLYAGARFEHVCIMMHH